MGRVLLLESSGFPEKFSKVEVLPPDGLSKEEYVEEKVITAINKYNPKLNITKVEYANLNDQFSQIHSSKFAGLIVEDKEIQVVEKEKYSRLGCYIWNENNRWFARRILVYVFFTIPKEESRNILVAQSIFPELIDYMGDFLSSPSYTIANHPVYFVNIINKNITAQSIIKPFAGIIAAGIDYIEVFPTTINPKIVPKDVEGFVKKYEPDCKKSDTYFSTEYYEVDFKLKRLKIKTSKLVIGDHLEIKGNYIQFNGSSEKFYWIQILPIFLIACRDNYEIDFLELENFYNSNKDKFSPRSDKIPRFDTLIKFMKKLTFR